MKRFLIHYAGWVSMGAAIWAAVWYDPFAIVIISLLVLMGILAAVTSKPYG